MTKMTISLNNPKTRALWARLDLANIRALDDLIEYLHTNPRAYRCYEIASVYNISVQKARALLDYLRETGAVTRRVIGTEEIERTHKDGTPFTMTVDIVAYEMVAYYPNPEPIKPQPQPARVVKSISQEIAEAKTAEDLRKVLERIERFEFCAEMADSYKETLIERALAEGYRVEYHNRVTELGLA